MSFFPASLFVSLSFWALFLPQRTRQPPEVTNSIGFGAGMLAAYLINNSIFPFLVTCLAAFLLTAFCQMFRLWIFRGASFWRLLAVALGQSVFSLPLAVPYYYICRAYHRRRAQR